MQPFPILKGIKGREVTKDTIWCIFQGGIRETV